MEILRCCEIHLTFLSESPDGILRRSEMRLALLRENLDGILHRLMLLSENFDGTLHRLALLSESPDGILHRLALLSESPDGILRRSEMRLTSVCGPRCSETFEATHIYRGISSSSGNPSFFLASLYFRSYLDQS